MRCLMVDRITSWENDRITGIKNVTMSENFLQDHFPDFPVMPGMLQLESVSQLGSWLVYATSDGAHLGRLAGVQAVKFKGFVLPGDQMELALEVTRREEDDLVCNARVQVGGRLTTEFRRLRLTAVSLAGREDPETARKHFEFITGAAPYGNYTGRGM